MYFYMYLLAILSQDTNIAACRCYEIQCFNGTVVGNYTADEQAIPLPIAVASPPYTWNFTSGFPTDDNNDTFPGNLGANNDTLMAQCWHKPVSATEC